MLRMTVSHLGLDEFDTWDHVLGELLLCRWYGQGISSPMQLRRESGFWLKANSWFPIVFLGTAGISTAWHRR
jgi:hypothetical protein